MLLTKGGGAGTWDGQASTAALAAKGAAMRCEPKGATAMLMADALRNGSPLANRLRVGQRPPEEKAPPKSTQIKHPNKAPNPSPSGAAARQEGVPAAPV